VREANSVLKSLRDPRTEHRFFDEALVALGLGKVTETLGLLRSACEEREFHVVILKVDPRFARLRSNPEFQAILAQLWRNTGKKRLKERTLRPVEAAGAERSQLTEGE
jgi:hypothetical protein